MTEELPALCQGPIEDWAIREQWDRIIMEQDEKIKNYGRGQGLRLGTTATVLLLTQSRYYILNVGDSRVYEISDELRRLTNDQTLVAREVSQGRLTEEEAERDPRRNVLLQCVGASRTVCPEMMFGSTKQGTVYMLCSDGFRHELSPDELYENLRPERLSGMEALDATAFRLAELCKQRRERDNISVILIRSL